LYDALSGPDRVARSNAATVAIPKLVDLYLSVAPRSASLRGDPVMAKAGQHIYWQYEQINSVDALKAGWDELARQSTQDARVQSWGGQDDTLMTEHILAALAEIGPCQRRTSTED
jgi:hypothetical protein